MKKIFIFIIAFMLAETLSYAHRIDNDWFYRRHSTENRFSGTKRFVYNDTSISSNGPDRMYRYIDYDKPGKYDRTYSNSGVLGSLFGYNEKESITVTTE